ncbi:hypothetical protein, partial [Paenibacillus flagellatus]|uniref:hypothetical protein n=1 Tax=Paenibacillus flagellatus TaxID=2211139 RepID=UPI001B85F399
MELKIRINRIFKVLIAFLVVISYSPFFPVYQQHVKAAAIDHHWLTYKFDEFSKDTFNQPEFRKRIRMRWRSSRSGSTTVNKWEWDQRNFETNIHMGITP